jgi:hypothetical protein
MAWTIPASSPFAGPTAIRGRLHFQIKNRGDQSAKKQNHSEPNQPTAAEHEVQTERIAGHYLASEFASHEPSGKMRGTLMALRLFSVPLSPTWPKANSAAHTARQFRLSSAHNL